MKALPCIVCIVHCISTYFWPFYRPLLVANINWIGLKVDMWLLKQRWNAKTLIRYKVLWPEMISLLAWVRITQDSTQIQNARPGFAYLALLKASSFKTHLLLILSVTLTIAATFHSGEIWIQSNLANPKWDVVWICQTWKNIYPSEMYSEY